MEKEIVADLPLTKGLLAASNLALPSPGLPDGVWRDEAIRIVLRALGAQLPPAAREVLRFYAESTRPLDWTEPGRGPVAFTAQKRAIERLGLARKTVYNAERLLERLGLVEIRTEDCGHRHGPERSCGTCSGLYFAPLIARFAAFVELSAEAEARAFRLREARGIASERRFTLRRLINRLPPCSARDAAHVAFAKTPKAIKSETDIAVLEQICTDLKPYIDALEAVDRSRPGEAEAAENTHGRGPDDPRHIYTTTNSSSVNCNPDPGSELTASDEADDGSYLTSAKADEVLRNQNRGLNCPVNSQTDGEAPPSPPAPVAWRIDQIYAAAGPEFRALLDQARDGTGRIRPRALPNTAETIARWLGINRSAWLDACHVLGPHRAALALLVIDRNRLRAGGFGR